MSFFLRPEFPSSGYLLHFFYLSSVIYIYEPYESVWDFFAFSWVPWPCSFAAALPQRPPCSSTHPIYRPVRWLAVALSISHLGVPLTPPICPSNA